jgi:SAM-dependent methyltransferase
MQENKTIEYYNKNAQSYYDSTCCLNLESIYKPFLDLIPSKKAIILDAGCGSGRDTKAFIKKGYNVIAFEGSSELALLAEEFTEQFILNQTFDEIDFFPNTFDGIWACASLLHIPRKYIDRIIDKLVDCLCNNGVFYLSFKYGNKEENIEDRFFNSYTEESFGQLLTKHPNLSIISMCKTEDTTRDDVFWLDILLRKNYE